MANNISFNEVLFTFNKGMQHMVLQKSYPEEKRPLIPLDCALSRIRGYIAPNF